MDSIKIVSGAQTGVDRAALDAALAMDTMAGGWCPAGRVAEDGTIPAQYPVTELPEGGYLARTRKNVIDSEGTLIIHFGPLSGGTQQTHRFCIELGKPALLIDGDIKTTDQAITMLVKFIRQHKITTLNVAGPRASGEARAYDYTKQLMLGFLKKAAVLE